MPCAKRSASSGSADRRTTSTTRGRPLGAAQLVAPLGEPAPDERREGGLEALRRDAPRQRRAQPGSVARRLVEQLVELLLPL